jgi:hypothetical protein
MWTRKRFIQQFAVFLALAVPAALALAGEGQPEFGAPIASRYEAKALPAFRLNVDVNSPDVAVNRLRSALLVLTKRERLASADEANLRAAAAKREVWQGRLSDSGNIEYSFDAATGHLRVVDLGLRDAHEDRGKAPAVGRADAVKAAEKVFRALARRGAVDLGEYDLQDFEISQVKESQGLIGESDPGVGERVVEHRIVARRTLNGVPVFGSCVRAVIHPSGAVIELDVVGRPLKAARVGASIVPTADGATVAVTRTSEDAKEILVKNLALGPRDRVFVERWGLGYVDTPTADQRYYQPAYVFVVSILTDTDDGTVAGPKLVRAIPASGKTLEALPFDPLEAQQPLDPPSDERPESE